MPASERHQAMTMALALLEDRINELEKTRSSLVRNYNELLKDEKSPTTLLEGLSYSILKTSGLIARCKESRDWFYNNIHEGD